MADEEHDVDEQDDTGTTEGEHDDAKDGAGADAGKGEGTDDGKPKPSVPDLKEMALRKANREAHERRAEVKRLTAELEELRAANASEAEKALIQAKKDAAEAADAKWKPTVVAVRAESALYAAGCKDTADQELLAGRIDHAKVELDEQGRVVAGLVEQVEELKTRYPKLFAEVKPPRVPSAREVGAGDKKPPATPKTATQLLAERLTGGGQH